MPQIERSSSQHWYVLAGDTYQGPLSFAELTNLLEGAALAQDSLLWNAGMSEWQPLSMIPEFAPYLAKLPLVSRSALSRDLDFIEESLTDGAEPVPYAEPRVRARRTNDQAWLEFFENQTARLRAEEQKKAADELARKAPESQGPRRRENLWIAGLALVLLTTAVTVAVLVPSLSGHRGSIQMIDGLDPDARRALEEASQASLKREGPRAGLAVSRVDAFAPSFVVASNLPDGTQLSLQIDGIPETLVERFKVSLHTGVTLKDGVARTAVFRQENGSVYPLGQYRVAVSCASCGAAQPVLAQKTFFLGQEVVSGDYERKLSSYHLLLRKQAQDELAELRQLSETLENQLAESDSEFHKLLSAPSQARARSWGAFHQRWVAFEEQLEAAFSHWTPEALDGSYYYAEFYSTLKKAGEMVRSSHQAATNYLEAARRDPGLAAKIESDAARARSLIQDLRERVRLTGELKSPSSGLPPRLGSN